LTARTRGEETSMSADNSGKQAARLRFRISAILVLRECLRLFFAWIMVWAAGVVALRAVFGVDQLVLLWGGLGLVAATLWGTISAMRKTPSSVALRAALDRHAASGGLVMAAGDTDIGGWQERIASVPVPAVRWRPKRQGLLLAGSAAFLCAAMLAPDRYLPSSDGNALQIGGEIEKLTEKIQLLKQEQILPPEKAKVLEKDLDRIRQEAMGKDPAKTMEAIDHFEQSFSKAAADAAQSAIKQTETASRAEELAGALGKAENKMDAKQFGDAMKELARMAKQAAAENQSLADELSDDLAAALQKGGLTDEQLQKLCKALKGCKAGERAKLMKLVEARLVDAEKLELCDKAGECDEAALAAALCQCEDGDQLAECLGEHDGAPGRGGVSRGRGDAAMTWQDQVKKGDAAFKEKVLPPAAAASLKKSQLAGVSRGDPTAAKPGGGSSGGVLGSAQAGGGEARTHIILPEHEKTVQRYFSREKK
jgi:hypothetical protein